jgi:hypothetical protein
VAKGHKVQGGQILSQGTVSDADNVHINSTASCHDRGKEREVKRIKREKWRDV